MGKMKKTNIPAQEGSLADGLFVLVGIRADLGRQGCQEQKKQWKQGKPVFSAMLLSAIVLGCSFCGLFIPKDPSYMDLGHCSQAPCAAFWFGTDAMGRDIFSAIWQGGRVSLWIGFLAAFISTSAAVIYGTLSGLSPKWLDMVFMRLAEIMLSIPGFLPVIFIQAVTGNGNAFGIAFAIGITGFADMAKVIRTEVRRLRGCGYVVASRLMGGGFFHILWRHLAPNFISSVMFMVVMDIRNAVAVESTLSFMGLGLPLEEVSWGSMLSLSERALFSGAWWMIAIPGIFLTATLFCVTDIGNYLRRQAAWHKSN